MGSLRIAAMEKTVALRSMYRSASACLRSSRLAASGHGSSLFLRRQFGVSRSFFSSTVASPRERIDSRSPFAMGLGSQRNFSEDVMHMPKVEDPDILVAFKDLMAVNWDELPDSVVYEAKKALSKNTEDKAGQEVLANVFRAAEAVEEFSGILVSLKMELDDSVGLSGENVKLLSDEVSNALEKVYERYSSYLDAFGPEEFYLKKKVEAELGVKMIHLKMRCGRLDSKWGKVTVLGTSGLSGSYIEQRG